MEDASLSSDMRLKPGTWITPTVRLVRTLGVGMMSSVWVAADMGRHCQVAVKVLAPQLRQNKSARARFALEGQLPTEIESPHLVQVHQDGELEDGTPFLVMEWLEGESLEERLVRLGPMPVDDALSVALQLRRALERTHTAGVVHRDIKPENVFLLRSQGATLVKLLDFGVAKRQGDDDQQASAVTLPGETLGTPPYMSPEQLRDPATVDLRADIWSFGALCYRMLLGKLPFDQETYPALCTAICHADYPAPSSCDPRWPEAFDRWCAKAMHLDKSERFSSAVAAGNALERALAGVEGPLSGVADSAQSGSDSRPPAGGGSSDAIDTLRRKPR